MTCERIHFLEFPASPAWTVLPNGQAELINQRVHARPFETPLYILRLDRQNEPHGEPMVAICPLVIIIDDDQSVRESLPDLLAEFGFCAMAFSSAEEFLDSDCVGSAECLILDLAMPGMSGLELQSELAQRGRTIPIVFITASQSDAVRDLVLSKGAVDCLFKPFSDSALLAALQAAFHPNAQ